MNAPALTVNRSPDHTIVDGSFEVPIWETDVPREVLGLSPEAPTRVVTLANGLVQQATHWTRFANVAVTEGARQGEYWRVFAYNDLERTYDQDTYTSTLMAVNAHALKATDQAAVTQIGLSRGCKSAVGVHEVTPDQVAYSHCMGIAGCSSLNLSRRRQAVVEHLRRGVHEIVTTVQASPENRREAVKLVGSILLSGFQHGGRYGRQSFNGLLQEIDEITERDDLFIARLGALYEQTGAVGVTTFERDRLCPASTVNQKLQSSGVPIHMIQGASHGSVLVVRRQAAEALSCIPPLTDLPAVS